MLRDKRSALSGYVSGLLSTGRTVFTADEAEQALGAGHGAFLDVANRETAAIGSIRIKRLHYSVTCALKTRCQAALAIDPIPDDPNIS